MCYLIIKDFIKLSIDFYYLNLMVDILLYIYIYMYMSWVQVILGVNLNNVISSNNLL